VFMGHLGIAMGARTVDRDVPVLVYVVAAVLPDLLLTRAFHAVVAAPVLAVVAWAVVRRLWRSERAALAAALLVLSHYAVDVVTFRLALLPGGDARGLLVYDRPVVDYVVEGLAVVVGWALWQRGRARADRLAVLAVLAVLLGFQAVFSVIAAGRVS
jgi:hypothetical protein